MKTHHLEEILFKTQQKDSRGKLSKQKRMGNNKKIPRKTWTNSCKPPQIGIHGEPDLPTVQRSPTEYDHIILKFPVTKLEGGYTTANRYEDDLFAWIDKHNLELYPYVNTTLLWKIKKRNFFKTAKHRMFTSWYLWCLGCLSATIRDDEWDFFLYLS